MFDKIIVNGENVNVKSVLVFNHHWKDFQELVQRGAATWVDAPAHIKEFADVVTNGKVLQPYVDERKMTSSPETGAFTYEQDTDKKSYGYGRCLNCGEHLNNHRMSKGFAYCFTQAVAVFRRRFIDDAQSIMNSAVVFEHVAKAQCSKCGRQSYDAAEIGNACSMLQPTGTYCHGTLKSIAPSTGSANSQNLQG